MSSPHGSTRKPRPAFALHGVDAFAKVLTRRHREVAQQDAAFAEALRKQTAYPQRVDALLARQAWFSGKQCGKCGSDRRRVRDCACYDCQLMRRPLQLDLRNRVFPWSAKHSRAGWLARLDAVRREKAGERTHYVAGEWGGQGPDTRWHGTETPTGGLAVRCDYAVWRAPGLPLLASTPYAEEAFGCDPPTRRFECPDLRLYDARQLYLLCERNPGLRRLLELAGW